MLIYQYLLKKVDLASSKSEVDKLGKVLTGLNSLKSKVVKLEFHLSKLSDIVENNAVKKTKYDELVKNDNNIETTDASNLVQRNWL